MVQIPADELENLKSRNRTQARIITQLQETLVRKNRELDAMHFVWCDGGCPRGVHRFSDDELLTEEIVLTAERNTRRLRSWYNTVRWRLTSNFLTASEWHNSYAKRAAERTDLA